MCYNDLAVDGNSIDKELQTMENDTIGITIETAAAAELFAQLPAAVQDSIIDLIKSLLSGQ